jgi:predicted DNA-binding transcriptional regulator AlpA
MQSIRDNTELATYSHNQLFNKRIWNIDDVVLFLGLSKKTIYNKVSRRELPYRKPKSGRRLYFVPEEILNWIEEGMR